MAGAVVPTFSLALPACLMTILEMLAVLVSAMLTALCHYRCQVAAQSPPRPTQQSTLSQDCRAAARPAPPAPTRGQVRPVASSEHSTSADWSSAILTSILLESCFCNFPLEYSEKAKAFSLKKATYPDIERLSGDPSYCFQW